LERQEQIVEEARAAGCYVAGVYREQASGARADRPELRRLIGDLQPGDFVVAERIDRISRLPLKQAERLVSEIREKGARLAVPGVVDLEDVLEDASGVTRVVLEGVQEMLLKVSLQIARDDYEERRRRQREGIERAARNGKYRGRKADVATHKRIIALREAGRGIRETAQLCGCSESQVKRIWAGFKKASKA
jgi:DNA invertase Pin-like site-specific DNA recombinase